MPISFSSHGRTYFPYLLSLQRNFASNLHRAGLDVKRIMRLGDWESLDMVVGYTMSAKFEESLRVMRMLGKA